MNIVFPIAPVLQVQRRSVPARLAAFAKDLLLRFAAGAGGDAAVADRAQINQQAAELLDTYGDSILRCAYAYLHNMSDAEEILQETLIRFLRAAPKLETPQHERAWLLHVASNLSKNQLRYHALRKTDTLSDQLGAQEREDLSFVWDAVKALPENFRGVIHLYYYEGYSTAEVARILDMKEATVRSHLRRGRAKLKQILKEAYDFEEGV